MRKPNTISFIFSLLFLCVFSAPAQILLSPQLPTVGLLQKKQLWNVLLINNYPYGQEVQLQMTMADAATGQKLLTGSSGLFTIAKGATLIRETELGPVQYNYSGNYTPVDRNGADLLMAGSYMICYTLISNSNKGAAPVAEECANVEIEPLSPPQLISPTDTSWVETNYPNFAWMPPAPAAMVPRLQYAMLLVEVKKGQSTYDAIEKNTPIYRKQYLSSPFLLYPSSGAALESGKHYAWQVAATNGKLYTQKTEAWSFSIKSDSAAIVIDDNAFPKLGRGYDAHAYICKGNMKFEYNNETGDSLVNISVYEWLGEQRVKVENRKVNMKPGQNFIEMQIGGIEKYKNGQQYLIEVINNRKETWNLKFKYIRD